MKAERYWSLSVCGTLRLWLYRENLQKRRLCASLWSRMKVTEMEIIYLKTGNSRS